MFPVVWKSAKIVPVLKAGEKSDIASYRPVAIIPNFAKAFEFSIAPLIRSAFKPILDDEQHGCDQRRSTVTNLMCFTQYVNDALRKGYQVDVVYTDFSKAFDRIDHTILQSKLNNLDIRSYAVQLLLNYLSNRPNQVMYRRCLSTTFHSTSGVPQGPALGSPIFNIHVNDVNQFINSNILRYADDMKFFRAIMSQLDHEALESDLDDLLQWCNKINCT
ncbi:uncharacterized protein LOC117173571 [Belonocnema kinseyi]|uniref:uncharacterized protein LOC117173571 n=1 Tax=Belonocnema kinseyi TaxID=2817044 RepID=UPI00143DE4C4|nr:uncharacterized protein LOC117173571 [Belonocnema kinseyi]